MKTTCALNFLLIYIIHSLYMIHKTPSLVTISKIYNFGLSYMVMARSSTPLIAGLCVILLPLAAMAVGTSFHIEGSVYCDTCRFGFETIATKYISGATVRIVCKDRVTLKSDVVGEAVTGPQGIYKIAVTGDRQDQQCLAELVHSSKPRCYEADPGRSTATVILTRSNGAASTRHFANAMGFLRDRPLRGCAALRKLYLADGDERAI